MHHPATATVSSSPALQQINPLGAAGRFAAAAHAQVDGLQLGVPLHQAAFVGHSAIVDQLLAGGADYHHQPMVEQQLQLGGGLRDDEDGEHT